MKFLFCVLIFLSGVVTCNSQSQHGWYTEGANNNPTRRIGISITNSLDIQLKEQPVVIQRKSLPVQNIAEQWIAVIDPNLPGNPVPSKADMKQIGGYLMRKETNGHAIPLQVDDIDKDGIWDEIFFMCDLAPHETRKFYIYIDPYDRGLFQHHVHGAIGNYGRHTVAFLESETMGWKLWYPHDLDLHGKRKPMLTAYYEYSTNKSGYYMPWEMGTDIMTVHSTFGSGGMCIFENPDDPENPTRAFQSPNKGKGPYFDTRFTYDVIFNGPLRSMIKVTTMNWNSGQGIYQLEQYYSAFTGKSWCIVENKFKRFQPPGSNAMFGAGIRHIMQEYKSIHKGGMAISMGKNVEARIPDEDIGDTVLVVPWEGIGIIVKDEYKPEYVSIKNYEGNHLFKIPVPNNLSYEYMAIDGWSFGSVNNNEKDFMKYVETESIKYNNPPRIQIHDFETKSNK